MYTVTSRYVTNTKEGSTVFYPIGSKVATPDRRIGTVVSPPTPDVCGAIRQGVRLDRKRANQPASIRSYDPANLAAAALGGAYGKGAN